jgi:hypothetical protein
MPLIPWPACLIYPLPQEWARALEGKDANGHFVWDQNAFNDLIRRGNRPLHDREDRLFM